MAEAAHVKLKAAALEGPATTWTHLGGEGRFLLAAIRAFLLGEASPPVPDGLDWAWVGRLAIGGKVEALLGHILGDAAVPDDVLHRWRHAAMGVLLLNTRALKAARKVVDALDDAGIQSVVLRGLPLAYSVYPDPSLRPMKDVDLLISGADGAIVAERLASRGMTPAKKLRTQVVYEVDKTEFEIHWSMLTPKRYRRAGNFDAWVDSRTPLQTPDGPIPHTSWELELLCLVTHAYAHHELRNLLQWVDIALVALRDDLDWEFIAQWSREAKLSRMVYFALALVARAFGLPLDDQLGQLGVRWSPRRDVLLEAHLAPVLGIDSAGRYLRRQRLQFILAQRIRTKLRQAMRLVNRTTVDKLLLASRPSRGARTR